MSDRDNTNFFTGLVLGAVVGAVIGLLYAPHPGKETRELFKEKRENARHKVEDFVDKVRHNASETTKSVQ